jgi:hypothetical protein
MAASVTDIRVTVAWRDHHKRKKLRLRLGSDGVLALLDLWLWTAQNHPDGVLSGMSAEDVEISANWSGQGGTLVAALVDVRLLDVREADAAGTVFVLHDWQEHQQWASGAARRSEAGRLAAKRKWDRRLGGPDHDSTGTPAVAPETPAVAPEKPAVAMRLRCGGNAPSPIPTPIPIPIPTPIPHSPACATGLILTPPEPESAGQKQGRQASAQGAEIVLAELNAARKRVRPTARTIGSTAANLKGICQRLDEGHSVDDCLHVVAVYEAESRVNPRTWDYFDAISPFRAENFERHLARDPAQATVPPFDRHGNGAQQARPLVVDDGIPSAEDTERRQDEERRPARTPEEQAEIRRLARQQREEIKRQVAEAAARMRSVR